MRFDRKGTRIEERNVTRNWMRAASDTNRVIAPVNGWSGEIEANTRKRNVIESKKRMKKRTKEFRSTVTTQNWKISFFLVFIELKFSIRRNERKKYFSPFSLFFFSSFLWMPQSWYVTNELLYWTKICCLVLHCNAQCRYTTTMVERHFWGCFSIVANGFSQSSCAYASLYEWNECMCVCGCVYVCVSVWRTRAHTVTRISIPLIWRGVPKRFGWLLGCLFFFPLRWRRTSRTWTSTITLTHLSHRWISVCDSSAPNILHMSICAILFT